MPETSGIPRSGFGSRGPPAIEGERPHPVLSGLHRTASEFASCVYPPRLSGISVASHDRLLVAGGRNSTASFPANADAAGMQPLPGQGSTHHPEHGPAERPGWVLRHALTPSRRSRCVLWFRPTTASVRLSAAHTHRVKMVSSLKTASFRSACNSHTRTDPSSDAVASHRPFGEVARSRIGAWWPRSCSSEALACCFESLFAL